MKKVMIIITFFLFQNISYAYDLDNFKKTCSDLGFEKGTEKYGSCVITLLKNSKKDKSRTSSKVDSEDKKRANLSKHRKYIQDQQNYLLRQEELKQKEALLRQLKEERSLRYLGIATKGLEMIGPKNNSSSSSSSSSSKTYNFGCRTYGVNTLCSGN